MGFYFADTGSAKGGRGLPQYQHRHEDDKDTYEQFLKSGIRPAWTLHISLSMDPMVCNNPSGPEIGLPGRKTDLRPGSTIASHRVQCSDKFGPNASARNPSAHWTGLV